MRRIWCPTGAGEGTNPDHAGPRVPHRRAAPRRQSPRRARRGGDDAAGVERAQAADRHERPAELGRLEISITPQGRLKPGDLEAYAELGVDRLILQPGHHRTRDEILAYVEANRPTA